MTTKEQIIQEIDQVPEPLLEEILQFIRSRKKAQVDPVEAYLDQLLVEGKYAEDVSLEELAAHDAAARDYLEGRDRGLSAEELKAELFGLNTKCWSTFKLSGVNSLNARVDVEPSPT